MGTQNTLIPAESPIARGPGNYSPADPACAARQISSNRREGVQCKGNSKAVVEANTITNNLVGISVRQLGAPTVLKNSIQSNIRAGITVAPTCPISDLTDNDVVHNGEGEITPRGSDSDSDSDEENIEIFTPKTPYRFGGTVGMPPRRGVRHWCGRTAGCDLRGGCPGAYRCTTSY